jgi:hypothetical protein
MVSNITIPVPESLAALYEQANDEDKTKMQWLIEYTLEDFFKGNAHSLLQTVREIGHATVQRGLTKDILQDILHDE